MQIQIVELIKGSEVPAGDGITGAMKCVIRTPDTTLKAAILKRGPIEEIFAEGFCALVLRSWGLPVPVPYLISEENSLSFASADAEYPNLKQSLGFDQNLPDDIKSILVKKAINSLFKMQSTHLAIACDEAINNKDRNLGNVLTDGTSEVWIDHAKSLGNDPRFLNRNILCELAAGTEFENGARAGAIANSTLLMSQALTEADSAMLSSGFVGHSGAAFVQNRLSTLVNKLLQRFPSSVDLFEVFEKND